MTKRWKKQFLFKGGSTNGATIHQRQLKTPRVLYPAWRFFTKLFWFFSYETKQLQRVGSFEKQKRENLLPSNLFEDIHYNSKDTSSPQRTARSCKRSGKNRRALKPTLEVTRVRNSSKLLRKEFSLENLYGRIFAATGRTKLQTVRKKSTCLKTNPGSDQSSKFVET